MAKRNLGFRNVVVKVNVGGVAAVPLDLAALPPVVSVVACPSSRGGPSRSDQYDPD